MGCGGCGVLQSFPKSGVYDINNPSNTNGGYGGGIIRGKNGRSGSFEVATGNKKINGALNSSRGTVFSNVDFHVLKY